MISAQVKQRGQAWNNWQEGEKMRIEQSLDRAKRMFGFNRTLVGQ